MENKQNKQPENQIINLDEMELPELQSWLEKQQALAWRLEQQYNQTIQNIQIITAKIAEKEKQNVA